ncbi:hypothetical protein FRX31_021851, partial [Thalictrum thalictroides]
TDPSRGLCCLLQEHPGATCPANFPRANTLETSETIIEYCKLGCVSSVCSSIITFQNSAGKMNYSIILFN